MNSRKNIYFCFTDYAKTFDCVDQNILWKFLKKWEYQTILPISWETYMGVKKWQLEPYMEQWTGSKLGKDFNKPVYHHPVYLTYMHHTKWWARWITSWNQDCWEKCQQLQICRWYHSNSRKQRGNKEPLDEGERGEWKSWLKTQHSKNLDNGI